MLAALIGLLSECLAVGEVHILFVLTYFVLPAAIHRHGDVADGGSFREVFDFGIAGEVSDQDDFVE